MLESQVFSNPPILSGGDKRIEWVDTAKALGLFLVFWGHLLYNGSEVASIINRAIYSFHMPMYFILSGYVYKADTLTFFDYTKRKAKRILLPALLLYMVTFPLYFHPHYLDYSSATLWSIFETVFYIKGVLAYNDPVWFFICIFQVLVLVKLLDLPKASNKALLIVAIISLFISYVLYKSEWEYSNFMGIINCFLGLFYYIVGVLMKRIKYENFMMSIGLLFIPVWILFGIILNTKCGMYCVVLENYWFFIVSSIAGSMVFYLFSRLLEKIIFIRQYAKWTVFIVCTHLLLVNVFNITSSIVGIKGTYIFDITSAMFALVALYFYKYVCLYLEKRIPILFGK